MPSIVDTMAAVSRQLTASIEASRENFSHNLTKGEAVEASVRKFLRDHLPDSIGVAHGQVVDRHGDISKQLDVILYDARRTPILYSDEANENRIVPVEGVIAAVEAKTNLKLADLPALSSSARTLKTLDRSAYYLPNNPIIQNAKQAFGRDWDDVLPPMYFVLAFEGPELSSVASSLAIERQSIPLRLQIDTVCIIKRGLVTNSTPVADGIDALPYPGSVLLPHATDHALLFFYILLTRYVLQAEVPPVAIQKYLPSGFGF